MEITYYGHSCFEVTLADKKILFDPFITGNGLAENVDVKDIQPDYVLVTHGHNDHISDAVRIANRSNAVVIAPFEVSQWFAEHGIEKVRGINHGGTAHLDFGFVKAVNAVHSSSLPDGSYGGNPVGYVFGSEDETYYYSGDTALTKDMELTGEKFDIDAAFLCIGDTFTMGVEDAAKATEMIGCGTVIGMHFDTFPPIRIDHDEAIKTFSRHKTELILLEIEERLTI